MKTHAILLFLVLTLIPFMEDARSASAEKKDVPTLYSYTDLGSLSGSSCTTEGIKGGKVTGFSATAADPATGDAFLYHKGVMEDLGTLNGGTSSVGYAVNSAGQVTGSASIGGNAYHAFLYSNGAMRDLGTLGGNSVGNAINSAGYVTGDTDTGGAFLYKNGRMESIGLTEGRGINSSGDVVGALNSRAYLYSHGILTNLNSLLDSSDAPYVVLQIATAISNNGFIAVKGGDLRKQSADGWAFLIADGTVTNLGSLGGDAAYPLAVNSDGVVVGHSLLSDFISYRAFVYSDGTMTNLNTVIEPSHPLPPSIFYEMRLALPRGGRLPRRASTRRPGLLIVTCSSRKSLE
jgi:probable HAF family extracellular repeat protein